MRSSIDVNHLTTDAPHLPQKLKPGDSVWAAYTLRVGKDKIKILAHAHAHGIVIGRTDNYEKEPRISVDFERPTELSSGGAEAARGRAAVAALGEQLLLKKPEPLPGGYKPGDLCRADMSLAKMSFAKGTRGIVMDRHAGSALEVLFEDERQSKSEGRTAYCTPDDIIPEAEWAATKAERLEKDRIR